MEYKEEEAEYISIHAPRKGERRRLCSIAGWSAHFNPRSPQGGATFDIEEDAYDELVFQSTLPARGSD